MTTNEVSDGSATREVRRRLEEERRKREAQLVALEEEIDRTPLEEVEAADYSRAENLRQSLAEIDGALRRVDEGAYGRCEGCAQDIPAGRLEILPYARYCVRCQGRATR
ncbi:MULTISPECIES: TraR/DksA family transcriptional regulator [Actinomadura]|uniref:TraR/DksA family transcriptional regulator n=1 Tax=Actinomadura TaxID=1988 RepID=UPI000401AA47|nr:MULTISPECIES: TraR/DksA C4-type zinc finger protein [Actinomadura]RSN66796.1 molecular chaperone DnaK [Actinomadura sp. WAC 06369]